MLLTRLVGYTPRGSHRGLVGLRKLFGGVWRFVWWGGGGDARCVYANANANGNAKSESGCLNVRWVVSVNANVHAKMHSIERQEQAQVVYAAPPPFQSSLFHEHHEPTLSRQVQGTRRNYAKANVCGGGLAGFWGQPLMRTRVFASFVRSAVGAERGLIQHLGLSARKRWIQPQIVQGAVSIRM